MTIDAYSVPSIEQLIDLIAEIDELAFKDIEDYGRSIRAAVRGLWTGDFSESEFVNAMVSAVRRGITQAWLEGASACGVMPSELSPDELSAMQTAIVDTYRPVGNFAYQVSHAQRGDELLRTHLNRAALWTNRYNAVMHESQLMACADQKLKWVLGPTKEHCDDCLMYHGRVYRASVWRRYGIQPQSHDLACSGWRCLCKFQRTNEPAWPGHPPLPAHATPLSERAA